MNGAYVVSKGRCDAYSYVEFSLSFIHLPITGSSFAAVLYTSDIAKLVRVSFGWSCGRTQHTTRQLFQVCGQAFMSKDLKGARTGSLDANVRYVYLITDLMYPKTCAASSSRCVGTQSAGCHPSSGNSSCSTLLACVLQRASRGHSHNMFVTLVHLIDPRRSGAMRGRFAALLPAETQVLGCWGGERTKHQKGPGGSGQRAASCKLRSKPDLPLITRKS